MYNGVLYLTPLITKNNESREVSRIEDNYVIYDLVNGISTVPYKINRGLLKYILSHVGVRDGLLLERPKSKLANKKLLKTKLEKEEYLKAMIVHNAYYDQEILLKIAKIYINLPEISFPVTLYFRGRLYCATSLLNYEGNVLYI